MSSLEKIAPAFVDMAHRIVWASAATVDSLGRPRSRVLHPIWEWDGDRLHGWIATVPTPLKRAHVQANPYVSVNYWTASHDTCTAECDVEWAFDDDTCIEIWEKFKTAPAPVGYDPAIIPQWSDGPTSDDFAVLRLRPWLLRVMSGTVITAGAGETLSWRA